MQKISFVFLLFRDIVESYFLYFVKKLPAKLTQYLPEINTHLVVLLEYI